MKNRKAFNFYKSYYQVALELSDKDKVDYLMALLDMQFTGTTSRNLTGMAKLAYVSQKHSIQAQIEGYLAKVGGEVPPTVGGYEGGINAPKVQVQEEVKEKVQVQVQEEGQVKVKNDATKVATIEERANTFMQKVAIHIPEYSKEMLREFFDYWTEMNDGGKKMRFEMQKVFDISKRLKTWDRNNKFKSNGTGNKKGLDINATLQHIANHGSSNE